MIDEMLFPGPIISGEDVAELERAIGTALPADYREFMLRWNGGRPFPQDTFAVHSGEPGDQDAVGEFHVLREARERHDVESATTNLKGRIPDSMLVIGACAGSNNILLGIGEHNHGEVYLWRQDDAYLGVGKNVYPIAESFTAFLESRHECG